MRSQEKNFTIQKNLYKVDLLINRRLQAVFEPEKYISKRSEGIPINTTLSGRQCVITTDIGQTYCAKEKFYL